MNISKTPAKIVAASLTVIIAPFAAMKINNDVKAADAEQDWQHSAYENNIKFLEETRVSTELKIFGLESKIAPDARNKVKAEITEGMKSPSEYRVSVAEIDNRLDLEALNSLELLKQIGLGGVPKVTKTDSIWMGRKTTIKLPDYANDPLRATTVVCTYASPDEALENPWVTNHSKPYSAEDYTKNNAFYKYAEPKDQAELYRLFTKYSSITQNENSLTKNYLEASKLDGVKVLGELVRKMDDLLAEVPALPDYSPKIGKVGTQSCGR